MSNQFAYTTEYQTKVLSLMLTSPQFCELASDALQGENFANTTLRWFYDRLVATETPYTPATLKEELIKSAAEGAIKESEVNNFVTVFNEIKTKPSKYEEEHIYKTLAEFVKHQRVKKAFQEGIELLKAGGAPWDKIVESITTAATTELTPLNLGHKILGDFQDRLAARMNETESFKMPTGIPELDTTLGGGLEAEQLGLIVGGTGRGKSVFLAHLARHAMILGYPAVYYTLELSESVMARRFDSTLAHVRPQELKDKNTEVFHKLKDLGTKHKNSDILVKGFPTGAASVRTIRTHYRQILATGFEPRIIIVDYLDLLKSARQYKDYRFELDDITKSLRGLSQEFGVPVWTASQLNRAGMAMETPDETSIAEALLKLFTVDVCLFMAQTKDEREDEIMRIFVGKNRNGPAGRSVQISTDYSYLTFFRDMLQKELAPQETLS